MSVYFDTSALLPIFVAAPSSARMNALLDTYNSPIVISDLCISEFASALSRRVRTGDASLADTLETLAAFDEWCPIATRRLPVLSQDVVQAGQYVRLFELKLLTPDAIHLAICKRAGLSLVTLDQRLALAAEAQGVDVVDLAA